MPRATETPKFSRIECDAPVFALAGTEECVRSYVILALDGHGYGIAST